MPTTTEKRALQPREIIASLYEDTPVEHGGWLIRINAETDTVEVFPPEGDTRHNAFETDLCHLERAVTDFCRLAAMPIPGVITHPKDQVSLGSPQKVLGPDSSVGEGWKNPKVNERPGGLDQKGTKAPKPSLGPDSSSQNVPHFNPPINKRPKDPVGRGGLSDPTLGPDSSGAPTRWRDRIVEVQEDGRVARTAESDPFEVTPVEEPGKHPNKGEDPTDPSEVIFTEQGEHTEERDESEGKSARIVDSFEHPRIDASSAYRQMMARRPSEELIRDIMDPQKWVAANLLDPRVAQMEEDPGTDSFEPSEDVSEEPEYFTPDAEELVLYITNDGELYDRQLMPIVKNLMKKMQRGVFDEARSVDLWRYLAEAGAKKYVQEFAETLPKLPWNKIFPTSMRQEAAQMLAEHYNPAIAANEFGGLADDAEDTGVTANSNRVAGPRLRENWGGDGAYGRDLEAESAEELHALTLALGGQDVDLSKYRPSMPAGEPMDEDQGAEGSQPEGPKAEEAPAPVTARSAQYKSPVDRSESPDPSNEFLHPEGNPPVSTGQQMGPGNPVKQGQALAYDDDFDPMSPEYLAESVINGNWSEVLDAVGTNAALAFQVYGLLPEDSKDSFLDVIRRNASKEAVDESAKNYWSGYFGDYGKDLTEEKKLKKAPSKKAPSKDDAKEARRQALLRARREAQQAAPVAQPAAPAMSPSNPPAKAPNPGAPAPSAPSPGAPPSMPAPGSQAPKAAPGGSMPSGTGDQGLQSLGWTSEDISLMDETDKKKILQVQLSKPGSSSKPKMPGSDSGAAPSPGTPSTPAVPKSPIAPTPGPVPAGPVPAPTAAVRERLARMINDKLAIRKNIKAQAAPAQSAQPGSVPPVGMAPAQTSATPTAGPTTGPGKNAPGDAATPPEMEGEGSTEQKAFDILKEVQQAPVSASTPEQVLSSKVSELARRLLTEIGMTTSDAKRLFGIQADGGLDKLFQ